jgi:hypothetical protein
MQSQKLAGGKPGPATQKMLDISEIRDGCVVMRDGTLRSVLLVSSVNFALKSEDEQEAMIGAYVGFLNTLDFPLQIVVQSRKLNLETYLDQLKKSEKEQTNDLLKAHIADYRNFVGELVEMGEIMSKRFFVVVQYDPLAKRKKFLDRLTELFTPVFSIRIKDEQFKKKKAEMMMRVEQIINGLMGMGLTAITLDTQGLIELYYDVYNPDIREAQKINPIEEMKVEAV